MTPRFSVCVPNYNSGRFIAKTIESVLAQTVPADQYEIIVSDNASSDNSLQVIGHYIPRIRLVRQPATIHVIEHWNACLREANGDYVILLHSDDMIDRDFLKACGAVLDSRSGTQMVSCLYRLVDESGLVLNSQQRCGAEGESPLDMLLRRNHVSPPSLLVRRSFYALSGYYNPEIRYCADYDLAVRGAAEGGLVFLDQYLCSYRRHSSNLGSQDAANLFDIRHTAIAEHLWSTRLGLNALQSRELHRQMVWLALLTTVCVLESGGRRIALQRLSATRVSFRVAGLPAVAFSSLWLLSRVPGAWRLLRVITSIYRHLTYRPSRHLGFQ